MSSAKYSGVGEFQGQRPFAEAARRGLAIALRIASSRLARLSRRLAEPAVRRVAPVPQLEFYAESGAPEGALYLEGRLIGWISGVHRL